MLGGNHHTLLPRPDVFKNPWHKDKLCLVCKCHCLVTVIEDLGSQWPYCHLATFPISLFRFGENNISKILGRCWERVWNLIIWLTAVCRAVRGCCDVRARLCRAWSEDPPVSRSRSPQQEADWIQGTILRAAMTRAAYISCPELFLWENLIFSINIHFKAGVCHANS